MIIFSKGAGVNIGLFEDADGEFTSCNSFDYDPNRCHLRGGDNYFVEVIEGGKLVWDRYWGMMKDGNNNSFDPTNEFEFEIAFTKTLAETAVGMPLSNRGIAFILLKLVPCTYLIITRFPRIIPLLPQ